MTTAELPPEGAAVSASRGVSAAEKYAELHELCKCHGEPKRWGKDRYHPNGGVWSCSVRVKATRARGVAARFQKKIESDQLILEVVHTGDQTAQKMIALMFDGGATAPEREVARQFLRSRRSNPTWHPLTTTLDVTQSTPQETKSVRALESSRGA